LIAQLKEIYHLIDNIRTNKCTQ